MVEMCRRFLKNVMNNPMEIGMKVQTLVQSALLACFILSSYEAVGDSPDFLVEMKIMDSGTEIAAPSMMIKDGVDGSIRLSGENSLVVGLVVRSHSEDEAHIIAKIESGGNAMSPELLVRKGQWASVSVGDLESHVRVEQLAATH